VSPLELDSELKIVANDGLRLMRQILWTTTRPAAEILVTRIEALRRVPQVFGTGWNPVVGTAQKPAIRWIN
jgi:hypothetical protein